MESALPTLLATPHRTVRADAGHLLALLELSDDAGEPPTPEPEPPPSPGSPWSSSLLLSYLQRASQNAVPRPHFMAPTARRLGRYHLIAKQGQGSQSEVWRAVQVSPHLAPVALKVLRPERARDPAQRELFLRAIRLSRRLPTPPWLPTLEAGEVDGYLYQAMPLVEGGTLADAIAHRRDRRNEPIGPWWDSASDQAYFRAVARVVAKAAHAVACAHEHGVVHRDIKPANILLDHWTDDAVYLIDLGLGREIGERTEARAAGPRAGTLMYMAPEALLGRGDDDALADVYALGATLYEAVTLAPPRNVPDGAHRSCLAALLATCTPAAPSAVCPALPRPLERIILKSIATDRDARYQSASALARDLDRFANRAHA